MAKSVPHPSQITFTFDPPSLASEPAALAGIEARIASVVAEALNRDLRTREVIAAEMSVLLDAEVSKLMMDAYASPARAEHSIRFSRFLALIAVTGRFDLLDRELREIGAAVLVGEEIHAARVGHLRAEKARIERELRDAERVGKPIKRSRQA